MTDVGVTFKKFLDSADTAGDAVFAGKLRDRAVVLRESAEPQTLLPWEELSPEERAFISILRIPRRFRDLEQAGALSPERSIAVLRALHAAEILDTADENKARALVPVELRKAIAEAKGQ